jgi:hypothetical protein
MKIQMIQFVSIGNLTQMKLMKVNSNMKNMMNKPFQHSVESKLIEVMNMKMQIIQFDSIVNLIQMKLMKVMKVMKVIYNLGNRMNNEFQDCMESKWIEVMMRTTNMQMIKFVSIVNVIQMSLMKVICSRKNMMNQEF